MGVIYQGDNGISLLKITKNVDECVRGISHLEEKAEYKDKHIEDAEEFWRKVSELVPEYTETVPKASYCQHLNIRNRRCDKSLAEHVDDRDHKFNNGGKFEEIRQIESHIINQMGQMKPNEQAFYAGVLVYIKELLPRRPRAPAKTCTDCGGPGPLARRTTRCYNCNRMSSKGCESPYCAVNYKKAGDKCCHGFEGKGDEYATTAYPCDGKVRCDREKGTCIRGHPHPNNPKCSSNSGCEGADKCNECKSLSSPARPNMDTWQEASLCSWICRSDGCDSPVTWEGEICEDCDAQSMRIPQRPMPNVRPNTYDPMPSVLRPTYDPTNWRDTANTALFTRQDSDETPTSGTCPHCHEMSRFCRCDDIRRQEEEAWNRPSRDSRTFGRHKDSYTTDVFREFRREGLSDHSTTERHDLDRDY